jgi:tetratricopeptide (TPR) repeat protein
LILEKIPLLALGVGACAMTVLAANKFIAGHADVPMGLRIGNALVSYAVYLRQMVWPEGLAASYPFPYHGIALWKAGLAILLLAGVSAIAYWQRGKQPWLLGGWLWYLVMLLPMAGLVQVGRQAHADRYTYLPQIGLYMAVTWLVAEWGTKRQVTRAAFAGVMAAVIGVLTVCAWKQTTYWQDSESIWTHALACTTQNDVAHYMLGEAILAQKGRTDEAMTHFEQALEINSQYEPAQEALGGVLLQKGKVDEAIPHLREAVQLTLGDPDPCFNLGNALLQKGDLDGAIAQYRQVVDLRPDYAEAQNNLGYALLRKGNVDEALVHCRTAVQLRPDIAQAHNNFGSALCQKGLLDEGIAHFRQALQIDPALADVRNNLGKALAQKQKGR